MNKHFILGCALIVAALLVGCVGGDGIGPTSPSLKHAAQKIAIRWGGKVSWRYTTSVSTKKGRRKTLTVKMEHNGVKKLPKGVTPELILGNALWLVYREAGSDLKDDDLSLKAILTRKNGRSSATDEIEYPIQVLRLVATKAPLYTRLSDAVMRGDAEAVRKASLHEIPDSSWSKFLAVRDSVLQRLNKHYVGSELLTFKLARVNDHGTSMPALSLSGILKGDDSSKQAFSIIIDTPQFNTGHYLYGAKFGL